MPTYSFACPCGAQLSTQRCMHDDLDTKFHEDCGLDARRIYEPFGFTRFPEHYNHSVGKHVSSRKGFENELKRASEEATARTGVEHNYVPVNPQDVAPMNGGVGLEKSMKARRDQGITEPKNKVFIP